MDSVPLIRKSDSYWARGSIRRSAAEPGGVGRCWSGGAFEDDGVAEGFELADVVTAAALGVDAGGVEARHRGRCSGRRGRIAGAR